MPYPDSSTYVKGVLSDFIELKFPNTKYRIKPIYTTLFDEIKRKTAYAKRLTNLEELDKKSINKQEFQNILMNIIDTEEDYVSIFCSKVLDRLNHEDVSLQDIMRYKNAIKTIQTKLLNKTNIYYQEILEELKQYIGNNNHDTLIDGARSFYAYLLDKNQRYSIVDANEIMALYMTKCYA